MYSSLETFLEHGLLFSGEQRVSGQDDLKMEVNCSGEKRPSTLDEHLHGVCLGARKS